MVNQTSSTTVLDQGIPVHLTCPRPFGYPEPYMAWVRDGIVYQNTTSTTVFQDNALYERRNESVWECIVSNVHGSDVHTFTIPR